MSDTVAPQKPDIESSASPHSPGNRRLSQSLPRLGFLGVGWIGQSRLKAIADAGVAEITAISDPSPEMCAKATEFAPNARQVDTLEDLLEMGVDGVVIATPSALHASQAIRALHNGVAVFCQKPLGRTAEETRRVIDDARRSNCLLAVDLSYRFVSAIRAVHDLCLNGDLGRIYAADLVFHNAYGPDKPWFYDKALSGGGCVMDLGTHLVDLALWNLGFPPIATVTSKLYSQGEPCGKWTEVVEDYCEARIDLGSGTTVRIACSWKLHAGKDALISGSFYGTRGGAGFSNINGSFYDFTAEKFSGTSREIISLDPEPWGGRAAVEWARRLAAGQKFDPDAAHLGQVAHALDRIYSAA